MVASTAPLGARKDSLFQTRLVCVLLRNNSLSDLMGPLPSLVDGFGPTARAWMLKLIKKIPLLVMEARIVGGFAPHRTSPQIHPLRFHPYPHDSVPGQMQANQTRLFTHRDGCTCIHTGRVAATSMNPTRSLELVKFPRPPCARLLT